MQAVHKAATITVEDYLLGEQASEIRHEYVAGALYAMAGASDEHNTIAGNIFAAVKAHLRGKACRVFIADAKVRLQVAGEAIFYYPDVMVARDPRDTDRYFKRFPKVLIEVLSEATERTDRREKFLAYIQIEALEEYVWVAQDKKEVTLFRRATGWRPELLSEPGQALRLASLDFAIPLAGVYEGVDV